MLKFATIESPIGIWEDKEVQRFMTPLLAMKMKGYEEGFKEKDLVAPFDTTDFIGNHIIIYKEENNKIIPLLAYKSCTLERCQQFNIPFSAQSSISQCDSEEHIQTLDVFIKKMKNEGRNVGYDGSLTINPILKNDPELSYEVHSMLFAVGVLYKEEYKIDVTLMLANLNFKTNKTFSKMGSTPFKNNGKDLDAITCPQLGFSRMQIYICNGNFSKKSIELSKQYKLLWLNRIQFNGLQAEDESLVAA